MAWIELHQTLPRHPKLARLANRLRVTRAQAAGHLTFLWLWALDYAPTGDLSALEPAEISAAADFSGDAELFCQALRQCGWIDENMRIHDWADYAGRIVTEREQARNRMREFRNRQRELRERSENVGVTSGERSELPNPTQPNRTNTEREQRARAGPEPPSDPPEAAIPTLGEVIAFAGTQGIPEPSARAFFDHYEGNQLWRNRHDRIINWRHKLGAWAANDRGGPRSPSVGRPPPAHRNDFIAGDLEGERQRSLEAVRRMQNGEVPI